MAVMLKRLYEQVRHMEVELVAGAGGMENMVRWVHMVESIDASSFLDGGELAFVTGIGLNQKMELTDLVKGLYEKHAAGVMVNTGPFIREIDEAVIRFCDAHDFPIFSIPWKIHLARVIQIAACSISKSDQQEAELNYALINAISFPLQEELYVAMLARQGFRSGWNYCVAALKLSGSSTKTPERMDHIFLNLRAHLAHYYQHFALFPYEGRYLLVLANYPDEKIRKIMEDIRQYLSPLLGPEDRVHYGVGRSTKSIRCLCKSYAQACSILKLQKKGNVDPSLIFYSDMGLYKLILGVENRELLVEYYDKTIAPLAAYDSQHGSDYTGLLRCYLENDCRKNETAAQRFIHRNSLNYSLHKIERILEVDLGSLTVCMQLHMGFLLKDLL